MNLFLFIAAFSVLQTGIVKSPAKYVNPFIGTEKMGHTYPGATVPLGWFSLVPIQTQSAIP